MVHVWGCLPLMKHGHRFAKVRVVEKYQPSKPGMSWGDSEQPCLLISAGHGSKNNGGLKGKCSEGKCLKGKKTIPNGLKNTTSLERWEDPLRSPVNLCRHRTVTHNPMGKTVYPW